MKPIIRGIRWRITGNTFSMADYDFGTLQVFVQGDLLDMHFPYGDNTSLAVVKDMRAHFDKPRKTWKLPLKGRSPDEVCAEIGRKYREKVPPAWPNIVQALETVKCITTRFAVNIGMGGVRLRVPAGHRHAYTLETVPQAIKAKYHWFIPASGMGGHKTHAMIQDILNDDIALYVKSIEYLEGFCLRGKVALEPDDPLLMTITVGATAYGAPVLPSFVDKKLVIEPIFVLPMTIAAAVGDMDDIDMKLDFMAPKDAVTAAKSYEARNRKQPIIDQHHLQGPWRRTRR
jgi:hypothetical protein